MPSGGLYDPYFKRLNYLLGKNHDELLEDPVRPLEPATKQYVDNQISGISSFSYRDHAVVGHEYGPSWGFNGLGNYSMLVGDIGLCFIAPIRVFAGYNYDQLRAIVGNASNSIHRFGIYVMSTTTWLPTSLLIDLGTLTWTGVGASKTIATSLSPSSTTEFLGLGWLYESRSDAVNPTVVTVAPTVGEAWPPGMTASVLTWQNYRIQSTGNAPGGMPLFSSFSHVANASTTQLQPMLTLRRSS